MFRWCCSVASVPTTVCHTKFFLTGLDSIQKNWQFFLLGIETQLRGHFEPYCCTCRSRKSNYGCMFYALPLPKNQKGFTNPENKSSHLTRQYKRYSWFELMYFSEEFGGMWRGRRSQRTSQTHGTPRSFALNQASHFWFFMRLARTLASSSWSPVIKLFKRVLHFALTSYVLSIHCGLYSFAANGWGL